METDKNPLTLDETEFDSLRATAWLTAYPRILTDLPLMNEIFEELVHTYEPPPLDYQKMRLAPELEARYRLLDQLLLEKETDQNQFLELASGFSPRGILFGQRLTTHSYVEMELPQTIEMKQKMFQRLEQQQRLSLARKLHLLRGNALSPQSFEAASSFFAPSVPLLVCNEGLLRYLTFAEKKVVALNILQLLTRFNGYWITSDLTTAAVLQKPVLNHKKIEKQINATYQQNCFADLEEARLFFEATGFEVVEQRPFLEIKNSLVSPARLGMTAKETANALSGYTFFVMRPRFSGQVIF